MNNSRINYLEQSFMFCASDTIFIRIPPASTDRITHKTLDDDLMAIQYEGEGICQVPTTERIILQSME